MMKKRTTTKGVKNLRMNSEVYALRRKVINLIYEAKTLVDLPRVEVRITEDAKRMLGCARTNDNVIWITQRAIESNDFELRAIVYHELLHAVFGTKHDDECPLMKPVHTPTSKKIVQDRFVYWANRRGN